MDLFRDQYLQFCRRHSVAPSQALMDALDRCAASSSLDLSGASFSRTSCKAMGETLAIDTHVTDLILGDALLGDDGCEVIAMALRKNRSVRTLDLHQNCIRCHGGVALGAMLQNNNTLSSLTLEWNAIGALDGGIAGLAEGLGCNLGLRSLDLRNNQISPAGARCLAAALQCNRTLENLDLRWNNIGSAGAKALLCALDHNRTLLSLHLDGNNISYELLAAIAAKLERNQKEAMLRERETAQAAFLDSQLARLEEAAERRSRELQTAADESANELAQLRLSTNNRIAELEEQLAFERESGAALQARLSVADSARSRAEQHLKEMGHVIVSLKGERTNAIDQLELLHSRLAATEEALGNERESAALELQHLRDQIQELILHKVATDTELAQLKQSKSELLQAQNAKIAALERQLAEQRQLLAEHKSDTDKQHQELTASLRRELLQQITSLESQLADAQRDKQRAEAKLEQQQLEFTRRVEEAQAAQAEALKQRDIEHREHMAEVEREYHVKLSQHTTDRDAASAGTRAVRVQLEEANAKHNDLSREIERLRAELIHIRESKDIELGKLQQTLGDLRCQAQKQADESKQQAIERAKLEARLESAQHELRDASRQHAESLKSRDDEVARLKAQLVENRAALAKAREDEIRRASALSSYVNTYMAGIPTNEVPPMAS
eukprot:m.54731 g.54731  ORF g.54731 m.54731 type:complete len:673 (+) comp6864_c0_seq3:150-2168(+)